MDVMREPGRTLSRDIPRGELVEKELDVFISRRHESRVVDEGERPTEEAWMESGRRHDASRREEMRAAWCEYHRGQAGRRRGYYVEPHGPEKGTNPQGGNHD